MPSDADKLNFARVQQGQGLDATLRLVAQLPAYPDDIKKRFPSMAKHEEALKEWHQKLLLSLKA